MRFLAAFAAVVFLDVSFDDDRIYVEPVLVEVGPAHVFDAGVLDLSWTLDTDLVIVRPEYVGDLEPASDEVVTVNDVETGAAPWMREWTAVALRRV